MNLLNKIVIAECDKIAEAVAEFINCPQDRAAGHVEAIKAKLQTGAARLYEVKVSDKAAGFFVVQIAGREAYVLAMSLSQIVGAFENIVEPFITRLARECGCDCIGFSTVRPGLIKQGLQNGFIVSEVVLRRYL